MSQKDVVKITDYSFNGYWTYILIFGYSVGVCKLHEKEMFMSDFCKSLVFINV